MVISRMSFFFPNSSGGGAWDLVSPYIYLVCILSPACHLGYITVGVHFVKGSQLSVHSEILGYLIPYFKLFNVITLITITWDCVTLACLQYAVVIKKYIGYAEHKARVVGKVWT